MRELHGIDKEERFKTITELQWDSNTGTTTIGGYIESGGKATHTYKDKDRFIRRLACALDDSQTLSCNGHEPTVYRCVPKTMGGDKDDEGDGDSEKAEGDEGDENGLCEECVFKRLKTKNPAVTSNNKHRVCENHRLPYKLSLLNAKSTCDDNEEDNDNLCEECVFKGLKTKLTAVTSNNKHRVCKNHRLPYKLSLLKAGDLSELLNKLKI